MVTVMDMADTVMDTVMDMGTDTVTDTVMDMGTTTTIIIESERLGGDDTTITTAIRVHGEAIVSDVIVAA